jgi:EAL domain-containing protein (putative c-di-GMP-specific phosphodiesterase class I)
MAVDLSPVQFGLPASELKSIEWFARNIGTDSDQAIISAIVALGQTFDLKIVAESVETVAQKELLSNIGCHSGLKR